MAASAATILDAIQNVFLPNRYHRITVLNAEGKIVNILSQKDIANFISRYPDILGAQPLPGTTHAP